jgi:hypothetical protein
MANGALRFPATASVYEVVRTHPSARARLNAVGITSDDLDYPLRDAARAVGMPVAGLVGLVDVAPGE